MSKKSAAIIFPRSSALCSRIRPRENGSPIFPAREKFPRRKKERDKPPAFLIQLR
jgi:hypothetical protein